MLPPTAASGVAEDAPTRSADAVGSTFHRDVFLASAAVMLLAAVLHLTAQGRLVLPLLDRYPLPVACLTRTLFHMDCPGCGLTRSFVATTHGDFAQAFASHRLGPLLFALVFLQLPIRAYALARRIPPDRLSRWRHRHLLLWAVVVALFANWVLNLITGTAFH